MKKIFILFSFATITACGPSKEDVANQKIIDDGPKKTDSIKRYYDGIIMLMKAGDLTEEEATKMADSLNKVSDDLLK